MSNTGSTNMANTLITQINTLTDQNKYEKFENDDVPGHIHIQLPVDIGSDYPGMHLPTVAQGPPKVQHTTIAVNEVPVKWSWCNLVTSVMSLFCCQVFGIVAVIMAVLAYVDHKVKDYQRSRHKRNMAWGFAVAGMVIGSVIILIVIILFAVVVEGVSDAMEGLPITINEERYNE